MERVMQTSFASVEYVVDVAVSYFPQSYIKRGNNQNSSGNEVYYTIFEISIVEIMLCSELHCQKTLRLKVFSHRISFRVEDFEGMRRKLTEHSMCEKLLKLAPTTDTGFPCRFLHTWTGSRLAPPLPTSLPVARARPTVC